MAAGFRVKIPTPQPQTEAAPQPAQSLPTRSFGGRSARTHRAGHCGGTSQPRTGLGRWQILLSKFKRHSQTATTLFLVGPSTQYVVVHFLASSSPLRQGHPGAGSRPARSPRRSSAGLPEHATNKTELFPTDFSAHWRRGEKQLNYTSTAHGPPRDTTCGAARLCHAVRNGGLSGQNLHRGGRHRRPSKCGLGGETAAAPHSLNFTAGPPTF